MTRSRTHWLLAVVLTALVVAGSATPAVAVSGTVQVDAALTDQTKTEELTFTFTADANTTVTATDSISRADGNVTLEFDSWEQLGGGDSSRSNNWTVVAGEKYRVTYVATVTGKVQDQTYSGTAEVSGDGVYVTEDLDLNVDLLHPRFGSAQMDDPKLVFDNPNAQSQSTEFDVTIPNTGQGAMKLSSVEFTGIPNGFSVEAIDVPETIDANDEAPITLRIGSDNEVRSGTHRFTMTVTDNLGNVRDVDVAVDVEKPPVASVPRDEVNVGDVLVGTSNRTGFAVEEIAGNQGISGMNVEISGVEPDAALQFDYLSTVTTSAGGSDTAMAVIAADREANQHERFQWDVKVTPDAQNAPSYTFTVTGRAIYPAKLKRIDAEPMTIPFDEPKSTTSSFEQTTDVEIENSGDLSMDVTGASATVVSGGTYLSASVEDVPNSVDGLSSGTATLVVEADDDTPEGEYQIRVRVQTAEAGTKRITRTVTVTQEPELSVRNTVEFGEVTITENRTETIDLTERLGFESIEGLTIKQVSGPEKWLTTVSAPSGTVGAGQSEPFVVAIQFDTSAELYTRYQWEFRVSGDDVETKNVTVSARAKPYSFDRVSEPLGEYESESGWKRDTATPVYEMLVSLEERLQANEDVPSADLSRGLAAGRATLLFVDSLDAARTAQSNGNYTTAQRSLARAAVAKDLMRQYAESLEQASLRSTAMEAVGAANTAFNETSSQQRDQYEQVLAANESVIANAKSHRALMRLASDTGDKEAAERHRQAYTAASERYVRLVEQAASDRAAADSRYAAYQANATLIIESYPLVLNPARADATLNQIARIDELYADAAAGFEHAGAGDEAARTRERTATVRSQLMISRYSLYSSIAVYGSVALFVLIRVGYRAYTYVQDAAAATSGDFLIDGPG